MIKGVIFDMDGTLVDNKDVHIESFIMFCKKHGMEVEADDLQFLFGLGNDEIMPRVFSREMTPKEIRDLSEEKEQIYRQIYSDTIEPIKGLIPLMKSIKKAGLKAAIGSSGIEKNVDFVVQKCELESYFDLCVNGDMVKVAKPAPDIFLLALKMMGIEPSECVIFEDSFAGVEAARAAGCKVVVLATTHDRSKHTDYDILIDDFTEIDVDQIVNLA